MNYYYKQVIISIKKHLIVDFRWDCNEGVSRLVFILTMFSIEINIPAVSSGFGAPICACA